MTEKEAKAVYEKLFGIKENKGLMEVMSKAESDEKFNGIENRFTETDGKIAKTLTDANAYTNKKTSEIQTNINNTITPQLNNKADKNLGNVANGDFLNKMISAGYLNDLPKLKFLTQPINLVQDSGKGNITLNVNGEKGLFYIYSNNIPLIGLNGRTGSLFCTYHTSSLGSDVTVNTYLYSSYSVNCFFFVDGINKPIFFRADALNVMSYFDVILPNITSLTFKGSNSNGSVKISKIAEII